MNSSFSDRLLSLEISLVLQQVGYALFGLFFAFLLKLLLPLALLQPAWQLQAAYALRTTAIFALLGVVLLLLAQLLRPESHSFAAQVIWVRRLALVAAIGFVLLIPLQVQAGFTLLGAGNNAELRNLRQVRAVAAEIGSARSEAAMRLAISHLPGAPAEFEGRFTRPLDQVRVALLTQLQPQIARADQRLAELRRQRLQGSLLGWFSDGLADLALAACFAAIGQLGPERSTLLFALLGLPALLRERLAPLPSGAAGRGSGAPVDAAWFESLQNNPSDDPADPPR